MPCVFERFGSGWLAMGCALALVAACGDDDSPSEEGGVSGDERDSGPPETPAAGAGGRSAGAGGRGGTGGRGGAGGAPSMEPDPSAYMCQPKPGDVGGTKESGAECCEGLGTCGEAGDATAGLPHETCKAQPDLRCVPKPPVNEEDAGTDGFASCRVQFPGSPPSAPSFEGRCLPSCFVRYSPIASRLSQTTCREGELCSPCYNPLTGASTGACERLGDSPLEPPLPGFTECSGGLGYCVPIYAAGSAADDLAQLTCAAGELCAPKVKVADPSACFERCNAGDFGAGACVPEFLAGAAAAFLFQNDCAPGELCSPCVALGQRTSVCD